ncbi:MAG: tetratricopeptide repeat protein, partial [Kiritimatiellia bacterium]|nr:tetratricopeptide repeat protein [Kiritimatiellia bacterium]
MSANPRFRRYVFAILLNILWSGLFPSIAPGADQDDFLTGAAAALEDEMYVIAEQNIRQYLRLIADTHQPKTEYIIMLAQALHGQQRYPEMLTLLVQNRQESVNPPFAATFAFWLALAFYDNSRWTAVLEKINDFENRYPDSELIPDIIRLKAKTLLKLDRDSEAISTQERLIKEYAHNAEIVNDRLSLGQMLANSGRTEEACAILEKLLVFSPDTSTGQKCRSILGRVYADQKQWQKARLAYEPLINQSNVPDDYRLQAIESLSEIAASQTNFSEALNVLENGYRLLSNPAQKNELSLRKGMLLLKMNKIDEGTTLIHNFVGSQTTNALGARVQLELAQSLLANGLNEKALIEFQNFLESFASQADLTEAYQGKGTALFNLGRYHEAAATFGKAEEISKNQKEKAQYRYRAADSLFAGGQFKTAAETYAQVSVMAPDTYLANMALFQTAECQLQMGNFSEAETLFWKVYDEEPSDALGPRALLRIADVLLQQNKLQAAETIYAWISQDYTRQWQARSICGRGLIAYRSGRFADALKYFEDTQRLAQPNRNI